MARRSYLPIEVLWGEQFTPIIEQPVGGETRFRVQLHHFHDAVRQAGIPLRPPHETSMLVARHALRTVPYPLLNENTTVLSECLCVSPGPSPGTLVLQCRAGDTYPAHMAVIHVQAVLYRWGDPGDERPLHQSALDLGFDTGENQLLLRLPLEVTHVIDASSPLAHWRRPGGVEMDATSEITFVVRGTGGGVVLLGGALVGGWGPGTSNACVMASSLMAGRRPSLSSSSLPPLPPDTHHPQLQTHPTHTQMTMEMNGSKMNLLRQRAYTVGQHVRWGHKFADIIKHPAKSWCVKRIAWGGVGLGVAVWWAGDGWCGCPGWEESVGRARQ